MATEIIVKKINNSFVPVDDLNLEKMTGFKELGEYRATFTHPRNLQFHRKFFALLDVAFDAWEPSPVEYKGQVIEKNRQRFRKDLIILAGFGEPIFNIKGEVRYEAKSISFAKMNSEDFENLYSKVIDVILRRILTNYTRDDLDQVVQKVLNFG